MGPVLKLFLSIILVLLIAMGLTWIIKKPKAPEVIQLGEKYTTSSQFSSNIEFFKGTPIETITPQVATRPKTISSQQPATATEEIWENIEIIITAKELKLTPSEITTKSGIPITIIFKNEDNIPLDLKISNENWSIKSELIQPGSSTTIEIKFPAPGEYEFYSTVPIAQEKNMKGKIIVK